MSVALSWNPFNDTAVDSFHVFRSITGFMIPASNSLAPNAQLLFQVNKHETQSIVFPAVDLASIVATINSKAKGLQAAIDTNGDILVRRTSFERPVLNILFCSFATQLGLTPGPIGPRQNFIDVGTVPFVSTTASYSFTDADGSSYDWYYLKTLTGSTYSVPTIAVRPQIAQVALCTVEGRVCDASNNPIAGARVRFKLAVPGRGTLKEQGCNWNDPWCDPDPANNASDTIEWREVFTDSLGRWVANLQQHQLLLIQIPATNYNEVVKIPDKAAALFGELKPSQDAWFAPTGEPTAGIGSVPVIPDIWDLVDGITGF
jgi:hypothetical protein